MENTLKEMHTHIYSWWSRLALCSFITSVSLVTRVTSWTRWSRITNRSLVEGIPNTNTNQCVLPVVLWDQDHRQVQLGQDLPSVRSKTLD